MKVTEKHRRLWSEFRKARNKKRLTQTELAEKLGKQQSYVAKAEGAVRGRARKLDVFDFIHIARALDLDPARLLKSLEMTQLRLRKRGIRKPT